MEEVLESNASAFDRSVRTGVIRPTAGVVEATTLNGRIRRFAVDAAQTVGRRMSDRPKRSLWGRARR